ncbi:restriction endonuclease subunit S, partial [Weissella hellenica]
MAVQPKLRFKGFTDDWEKRQLGNVVDKIKSYSLSRDVEYNESTGYKYVHYGDIHTGKADIINKKSVLPNIKPSQYTTLSVNDLIVTDASEDYQGIASPAVIQELPDANLVAGLHTIALRPQATNATFLYYLLHTNNFKHFGYRTGTGLKVFGISWPNLSKFEFNLPSLEEQDKVVDLLRFLDNLITVNQRKVNLLKKKKTAYLQKLFPKTGSNIPELRFKGYIDAW